MSLILDGSGTITGATTLASTIASPTLTTPALGIPSAIVLTNATGLAAAAMPAGSVLQVVQTVTSDIVTFSQSISFTDITGMTVNITPASASNKVLVLISVSGNTTYDGTVRLVRNSTVIAAGTTAGSRSSGIMGWPHSDLTGESPTNSSQFLDSPSSTSAVTYKLQCVFYSAAGYMNRGITDTDAGYDSRLISTITVMEIKG